MPLLNLPNELLLLVAEGWLCRSDINALLRTNSRFYSLLVVYLYRYDVQQFGSSALFWAARSGPAATAKMSLQETVDLRALSSLTQSLLVTAVKSDQHSVVELLLGTNAINPNCKNFYGRTPLLLAASTGQTAMAMILIDYGGELNHMDVTGATPLAIAAKNGHTSVGLFGRTPLRLAAENGHVSVVKLLVAVKAVDINCRDLQVRQTPLEVARNRGHETVVQVLCSALNQRLSSVWRLQDTC